mgnify:CR=1 FL=1
MKVVIVEIVIIVIITIAHPSSYISKCFISRRNGLHFPRIRNFSFDKIIFGRGMVLKLPASEIPNLKKLYLAQARLGYYLQAKCMVWGDYARGLCLRGLCSLCLVLYGKCVYTYMHTYIHTYLCTYEFIFVDMYV